MMPAKMSVRDSHDIALHLQVCITNSSSQIFHLIFHELSSLLQSCRGGAASLSGGVYHEHYHLQHHQLIFSNISRTLYEMSVCDSHDIATAMTSIFRCVSQTPSSQISRILKSNIPRTLKILVVSSLFLSSKPLYLEGCVTNSSILNITNSFIKYFTNFQVVNFFFCRDSPSIWRCVSRTLLSKFSTNFIPMSRRVSSNSHELHSG